MISMIFKGGWVMIPILLSSVVALTLTLERFWYFWKIRLDVDGFCSAVLDAVRQKRFEDALKICESEQHPVSFVLKKAIENRQRPLNEIEKAMEDCGQVKLEESEKNLSSINLIVGLCPMLGFLGTILGLIEAFISWEQFSTSVTVSQLASGIYQAMITTAAGLIIAIPYFVIYHFLYSRVQKIASQINHCGQRFLETVR